MSIRWEMFESIEAEQNSVTNICTSFLVSDHMAATSYSSTTVSKGPFFILYSITALKKYTQWGTWAHWLLFGFLSRAKRNEINTPVSAHHIFRWHKFTHALISSNWHPGAGNETRNNVGPGNLFQLRPHRRASGRRIKKNFSLTVTKHLFTALAREQKKNLSPVTLPPLPHPSLALAGDMTTRAQFITFARQRE